MIGWLIISSNITGKFMSACENAEKIYLKNNAIIINV